MICNRLSLHVLPLRSYAALDAYCLLLLRDTFLVKVEHETHDKEYLITLHFVLRILRASHATGTEMSCPLLQSVVDDSLTLGSRLEMWWGIDSSHENGASTSARRRGRSRASRRALAKSRDEDNSPVDPATLSEQVRHCCCCGCLLLLLLVEARLLS